MPEKGTEQNPVPEGRKKRTAWIHIMAYPEERVAWQAMAKEEGLSLADFIRQRLGKPLLHPPLSVPKRRTVPVADRDLIRQIARIGNNLNQIARKVNGRSLTGIEILVHLAAIERDIKEVLDGTH